MSSSGVSFTFGESFLHSNFAYLHVRTKDYGGDEPPISSHRHADVNVVVLAYEGLHPAGVGLGDLAEGQCSCLDDKVIRGELELALMCLINLLPKSTRKKKKSHDLYQAPLKLFRMERFCHSYPRTLVTLTSATR